MLCWPLGVTCTTPRPPGGLDPRSCPDPTWAGPRLQPTWSRCRRKQPHGLPGPAGHCPVTQLCQKTPQSQQHPINGCSEQGQGDGEDSQWPKLQAAALTEPCPPAGAGLS